MLLTINYEVKKSSNYLQLPTFGWSWFPVKIQMLR